MVRGRVLAVAAIAIVAVVMAALPATLAQEAADEYVKVTVLDVIDLSNYSDKYMYNETAAKLEAVNTSYVEILSGTLKDLSASDSLQPAVVLSLDAPTSDLNTNETIVYAYSILNAYGTLVVGVADINSTDNSVINLTYYKVSPVSGDVGIVRTGYDIVVEANGIKLSIPLENYSNPKVLLMTDDELTFQSINHLELRALTNPPSGYTLIRSGTGEAEFSISASGSLSIWFDEEHDVGDIDLFIYDSSNSYYSQASLSQSWTWLLSHRTACIFADGYPTSTSVTASGTVKFIVKKYTGNVAGVSWRVACRLSSSTTTQPQPPSTATTTSEEPNTSSNSLQALWGQIQSALSGSNTVYVLIAVVVLLFIIALVAVARR